MMKIFKALSNYFICDEDETAPLSDYIWFFGTLSFMSVFGLVFTIKLITF